MTKLDDKLEEYRCQRENLQRLKQAYRDRCHEQGEAEAALRAARIEVGRAESAVKAAGRRLFALADEINPLVHSDVAGVVGKLEAAEPAEAAQ